MAKGKEEAELILSSQVKTVLKRKAFVYISAKMKAEIITISPYFSSLGKILKLNHPNSKSTSIFQDFTWNLYGYQLKMAILRLYKPMYEVEVSRTGLVKPLRGFFHNMVETIYTKINLTTVKFLCQGFGKFPPGAVTGSQLPNGSWIGCMQDIISGRAEITVAAPTLNRYNHVQFLPCFQYVSIAFTTRLPSSAVSWKAIYKAYAPLTWLLTWIGMGSLAVILWCSNLKLEREFNFRGIGTALFSLMGILLNQSTGLNNLRPTSNFVILLWLECAWILGAAYTSKLTSLLTIPVAEDDIPRTFQELEEYSKGFRVGGPKLFKLGVGGEILKNSASKMMRNLHKRMETDEDGITCLKRAMTQDYACVSWNFLLEFEKGVEFADSRGVTPFQDSSEVLSFVPLTQIMKKGEIFAKSYSYFVENVYEMGLITKWAHLDKQFLRQKRLEMKFGNESIYIPTDEPQPLKLDNFQGSFGILGVGIATSASCFAIEFILFFNRRKIILCLKREII
ncbi:unnamed protein product [Orchesella dallaii]|uniref:Ionotropic glutamate receptor C-terminal domain-containing protein n=1 Tax=Orchesella dallaii TaxID=48710 RepID=A0ABP1R0C6_9HEXA